MSEQQAAAVQALLDKEAIRELVNIYCRAADPFYQFFKGFNRLTTSSS